MATRTAPLRLPRVSTAVAVPALVFAAAGAVVAGSAALAGHDPLAGRTWALWDSALYESIARHGYQLAPCLPGVGGPDAVCGNAGWFPGYPVGLAGVRAVGLPLPAGGVLLTWLFSLATVVLVWATFLRRGAAAGAVACLVVVACPPGAVYLHAEFPLAMLAFFTMLALWLLHERRWLAAMWVSTGLWNAYFLTQSHYGHGLHWPWTQFWRSLSQVWTGREFQVRALGMQTGLVALVVGGGALLALRRRPDATRVLVAATCVAMWLFPLTQANVALYRSEAALVPAALLVGELPRALRVAVAAALVGLAVPVTMLFTDGRLV